jgi:flagellar protein FliO/FliZ
VESVPHMTESPAHFKYAVAACLTTLVLATPAFAAETPEDKTPLDLSEAEPVTEAATSGADGGGIVRMIVGLAIVIGVIYGLSWVLRQARAAKEGQATGGGLAAISSLPLGPNRSVHLVRVGTDLVLLGAAEKGVTPIRTYSEDEARDAGLIADDFDITASVAAAPKPAAGVLVEALRKRTVRR